MLTAEQIQNRQQGVGCSELLAAFGKDHRCSRLELYKRKVGELPEPDLSKDERVHFGQLLEDVIRQEAARRIGAEVVVSQQTLFHPDAPLLGHPDGWFPALRCGLEVKMADKFEADEFGEEESDQVSIRYLVQCSGYMALTDADRWKLCVLIGGNDLRFYDIPRDRELEGAILAGVREFWSHVERRQPPDPKTPEEVRMRWPKDAGTTVWATDEIIELCANLSVAKSELKHAESREAELKADIQRFMKEASDLLGPDAMPLATWRTARSSKKFDVERFRTDHPILYEAYLKDTLGSRRFLLK
jgi:predicted phage-related endonuclease